MAGKNQKPNDFEDRFFDLLDKTISGIDKKVEKQGDMLVEYMDKNTSVMEGFNRRLRKLESTKPKPSLDISGIISNKSLVYLVFACALVFLLILASALGVKIPTIG